MINIVSKLIEFETELKKKIEKATKHINQEKKSVEDFYTDKEDKEKDDGLSL